MPLDYPHLSSAQRDVCELVRSGEPRIVGDVGRSLAELTYPIHFLDFETFMSALPLYPGTRPWQMITFQWSDHILHENGDLEHREFLYEGSGDPRPSFTRSLIEALGDAGSVVVYSSFENSRLNELAIAFPAARRSDRGNPVADLRPAEDRQDSRPPPRLPRQREHQGRAAGARQRPVLRRASASPTANIASMRYCQAATGQLTDDECAAVYADLREYCGTDTLAMVRLFEVLSEG